MEVIAAAERFEHPVGASPSQLNDSSVLDAKRRPTRHIQDKARAGTRLTVYVDTSAEDARREAVYDM